MSPEEHCCRLVSNPSHLARVYCIVIFILVITPSHYCHLIVIINWSSHHPIIIQPLSSHHSIPSSFFFRSFLEVKGGRWGRTRRPLLTGPHCVPPTEGWGDTIMPILKYIKKMSIFGQLRMVIMETAPFILREPLSPVKQSVKKFTIKRGLKEQREGSGCNITYPKS